MMLHPSPTVDTTAPVSTAPEPISRRQWSLGPSPAAAVTGLAAAGLALEALAYFLGYVGDNGPVTWLFFAGLTSIYAPCAVVLLARSTTADERRFTVVVLGLALLASSLLESPLLANRFDELLHQTTLWQLPYAHGLFTDNTALPVSPYYPGLELATLGVRLVTGLPVTAAEDVTVALARLALTVVLYLFLSRVARSERAGGIGVLVYAASPQFYSFNAAYSYQTLALAFGAAAVYFVLVAVDRPDPHPDRYVALAVLSLGCVVITHHLLSWLTLGLMACWTFAARRQQGGRERAKILLWVTLAGIAMCGAWSAIAARRVVPYLGPILSQAWSGFVGLVAGDGARRQLFHGSGPSAPLIQQVLVVASVLLIGALVVLAVWAVVFGRALRGGPQRFIPVLLALAYPVELASALSPGAAQVGERASTFVFLGVATVVGAWLVRSRIKFPTGVGAMVATVCFLGGVILGSGPIWQDVPGPYVPAADARSIDAPSLAAANWAAANLPVNATIAADRDNQVLMAAIGHLRPVTALGGLVNVGPIYFDPVFGRYERSLVTGAQIRYLLVDDRLTEGLPGIGGDYFEPGETPGPQRLTALDLRKFSVDPQFKRIYDNGPIQIYDLSAIDGTPAPLRGRVPTGLSSPSGNAPMEVAFLAVALGALVVRRRRGAIHLEGVATVTVIAMAGLVACGLLVVFAGAGIGAASGIALAIGAVGLAARRTGPRRGDAPDEPLVTRPGRRRAWLLVAVAVLAGIAMTVLDVAGESAWLRPPPAVSTHLGASGVPVADVILPGGKTRAALQLLVSGEVVFTKVLPARAFQAVALPPSTATSQYAVRLLVNGHTLEADL